MLGRRIRNVSILVAFLAPLVLSGCIDADKRF